MNKIVLRDSKNKKIDVSVVRYFKYQNNHYFIYTFGETDDKKFVKLYVAKILEELGSPVAHYIDDAEWEQMQGTIKVLLKQIKKGELDDFQDLDVDHLTNLKIKKARNFKLLDRLVSILSGEIVEETTISEKQNNDLLPLLEETKNEVISDGVFEAQDKSGEEAQITEEGHESEKDDLIVETSDKKENIYDIQPVIPIITTNEIDKIEEKEEIDIIEPIMITPILRDVEEESMVKEPIDIALDSIDREIEDISLDDFSDYLVPIEEIKEEVQQQEEVTETIKIPDFKPFEPSQHEKKLEDISNNSRMQMLSLENERLKIENQQLKDELREYKVKYQKLKDFIQTEI